MSLTHDDTGIEEIVNSFKCLRINGDDHSLNDLDILLQSMNVTKKKQDENRRSILNPTINTTTNKTTSVRLKRSIITPFKWLKHDLLLIFTLLSVVLGLSGCLIGYAEYNKDNIFGFPLDMFKKLIIPLVVTLILN